MQCFQRHWNRTGKIPLFWAEAQQRHTTQMQDGRGNHLQDIKVCCLMASGLPKLLKALALDCQSDANCPSAAWHKVTADSFAVRKMNWTLSQSIPIPNHTRFVLPVWLARHTRYSMWLFILFSTWNYKNLHWGWAMKPKGTHGCYCWGSILAMFKAYWGHNSHLKTPIWIRTADQMSWVTFFNEIQACPHSP